MNYTILWRNKVFLTIKLRDRFHLLLEHVFKGLIFGGFAEKASSYINLKYNRDA